VLTDTRHATAVTASSIIVGTHTASNRRRTSPTAHRGARRHWFCEGVHVEHRVGRVSILPVRPVRKRSGGSWGASGCGTQIPGEI
jgi:hypothetical protein